MRLLIATSRVKSISKIPNSPKISKHLPFKIEFLEKVPEINCTKSPKNGN